MHRMGSGGRPRTQARDRHPLRSTPACEYMTSQHRTGLPSVPEACGGHVGNRVRQIDMHRVEDDADMKVLACMGADPRKVRYVIESLS